MDPEGDQVLLNKLFALLAKEHVSRIEPMVYYALRLCPST